MKAPDYVQTEPSITNAVAVNPTCPTTTVTQARTD